MYAEPTGLQPVPINHSGKLPIVQVSAGSLVFWTAAPANEKDNTMQPWGLSTKTSRYTVPGVSIYL